MVKREWQAHFPLFEAKRGMDNKYIANLSFQTHFRLHRVCFFF